MAVSSPSELPAILGGTPAFPDGPPPWPHTSVEIREAVHKSLQDGTWGHYHGPRSCELEARLARQFGVRHALACSSGTLAVEVALRSLGVSTGDEVILAAYEYESNFLTVHTLGAKPVLVDVSPKNWNLAPDKLEGAITPKTKAILCSHLHGGVVPMNEVMSIAEQHGIPIIEDAAQCPGAKIGSNYLGTIAPVGTLSFGGSKLLSAGRGGAVLFQDSRAHQRAKVWLTRGVQEWATMSEIQAVVLFPQLVELDANTALRQDAVNQLKPTVPGLRLFENTVEDALPAYYKVGFQFSPVEFGLPRELFTKAMRAEGIAFDPGFRALHIGRSPTRFRATGDLHEARNASENCVILHHPVLLECHELRERVARAIEKVYRNSERILAASTTS